MARGEAVSHVTNSARNRGIAHRIDYRAPRWYQRGMKIIAIEREGANPGDPSPALLRAEAAAAWRLHMQGVIRQAWFTVDTNDAVLELECPSAEEASKMLAELPLVAAGVIRFDLLPLRPYDGFSRLFVS